MHLIGVTILNVLRFSNNMPFFKIKDGGDRLFRGTTSRISRTHGLI